MTRDGRMRCGFAHCCGVLHACALLPVSAHAQQDYPNRPIRMIVPYPPGGPTDIMGRLTSEVLTKRLGQNVVVDNRGGAATAIGAEMAARSPADGYTVLVSSETTFAVTPGAQTEAPVSPGARLRADLAADHAALRAGGDARAAGDLGLAARRARESESRASSRTARPGTGGANHLAGEMFKHAAGIDIVHVPYKGNGPAIIDLVERPDRLMLGSISSLVSARGDEEAAPPRHGEREAVGVGAGNPDFRGRRHAGFPGERLELHRRAARHAAARS